VTGTVREVTESVEIASPVFPASRVCCRNVCTRSKVYACFSLGVFLKILTEITKVLTNCDQ
jgi:hypothetical protein